MKRVLSLALVAVMALGMGVSAFASLDVNLENIKDFADGYTLGSGVVEYNVDNGVVNMGTVHPQDKPEVTIDLLTTMFTGNDISYSETTYYVVDVAEMINKGALPNDDYADFDEIEAKLPAGYEGFLRTAFANTASDAYNRADQLFKVYRDAKFVTTVVGDNDPDAIYFGRSLGADGEWIDSAGYKVANTKTVNNPNLSATEIRKSKITVGTTVKAGSSLIKDIDLVAKDGQIVVKLLDEFVSTKSQDVEVHVFLRANGKRLDNKGVTILATLENKETEVYADHNYVNLSEGYVAEAMEFNSRVAVDLGNGVTIHTKFFKGKKYYGIATRDADEEAERVFNQYKDVDNVVTLKTVGLNNSGDYITLNTDYSGYYVYDKDMNYLGKGDEELKFSSKLYLAYNKLEIEEDEEEEVEEAPLPTTPDNPETGGDGGAANNVNMNPGTGR